MLSRLPLGGPIQPPVRYKLRIASDEAQGSHPGSPTLVWLSEPQCSYLTNGNHTQTKESLEELHIFHQARHGVNTQKR